MFSRNGNVWTIDADGTMFAFDLLGRDGRIGIWLMLADGSGRDQHTFGKLDSFPDRKPA